MTFFSSVKSLFLRASDETLAVRRHFLRLLLAHRAAKKVRLSERISRDDVRDLHHLFLVDDDAVGFRENRLQLGEFELDLFGAVFPLDEVVDHAAADRAGSVERVQCREVLDTRWFEAAQDVLHSRAFKLEHAAGETV